MYPDNSEKRAWRGLGSRAGSLPGTGPEGQKQGKDKPMKWKPEGPGRVLGVDGRTRFAAAVTGSKGELDLGHYIPSVRSNFADRHCAGFGLEKDDEVMVVAGGLGRRWMEGHRRKDPRLRSLPPLPLQNLESKHIDSYRMEHLRLWGENR